MVTLQGPDSEKKSTPETPGRYFRKVLRVRAEDSPNVRLALIQKAQGEEPTGEVLVPGVLTWDQYLKRRLTWDEVRQCIGLDAAFYTGSETLMYPPEWLNRAELIAERLDVDRTNRRATSIGIDSAEGGDQTTMAAVDRHGLIELVSERTPDTSMIAGKAIAFGRKHNVPSTMWTLDRGGGGKQHADRLRALGYNVRTIAFGEAITTDPRRRGSVPLLQEKINTRESRYSYYNRRAEMYGLLRELLDPSLGAGFGLPGKYTELRQELGVIPLNYDDEGRLYLPGKGRRLVGRGRQQGGSKTLQGIIGHSPDCADALVIAVWGMMRQARTVTVGPMFEPEGHDE